MRHRVYINCIHYEKILWCQEQDLKRLHQSLASISLSCKEQWQVLDAGSFQNLLWPAIERSFRPQSSLIAKPSTDGSYNFLLLIVFGAQNQLFLTAKECQELFPLIPRPSSLFNFTTVRSPYSANYSDVRLLYTRTVSTQLK